MDEPAFGVTAAAYAQHRLGFPAAMYDRWHSAGVLTDHPLSVVDLGTGTGTIVRALAGLGHQVTGVDIDAGMLGEARRIASASSLGACFILASADKTGLETNSADLVTAGQCWHWFDKPAAAAEARRLLKPGGILMICYFDWLPRPGSLAAATEALILAHSPSWRGAGGTGIHPDCLADLSDAGFADIQSFTFDQPTRYTAEGWIGRIEASAGIAALDDGARRRFKSDLASLIAADFAGDSLDLPHRIFCAWGKVKN